MTATAETSVPCVPSGRYGLAQAVRMEWVKLRSLRSTWWTLAVTAAGTVGIGVAVGLNSRNAAEDLTNNALAGVVPGLLLAGVLGVLTMTSEYSSGTVRVTLAAIPRRPLVLAAKAVVFGAVTLVVGEAASFTAFLAAAGRPAGSTRRCSTTGWRTPSPRWPPIAPSRSSWRSASGSGPPPRSRPSRTSAPPSCWLTRPSTASRTGSPSGPPARERAAAQRR